MTEALDPDPDLVPAGIRPQQPYKTDDGAGEPTALHIAVLGDRCEPARGRTARNDRRRSHFHRGQPEPEFGDEIVVLVLLVRPAVARFRLPAAVLRARLAAAKSRRVNSRRLPAHRPHLEFPVRKCQEHNNDDPSNTPGYEGVGTGQQRLEEGTAEIIQP